MKNPLENSPKKLYNVCISKVLDRLMPFENSGVWLMGN